jgi:hypothetical protein
VKHPNGVILWQGLSLIDRAPIVVIATGVRGKSRNPKTGRMVQTWIMRSDVAPHIAVKTGDDRSVCGDCEFRPSLPRPKGKKPCYVRTWQAPRGIYAAFKRGRYPTVTPHEAAKLFAGRELRMGSYGNPSAAPLPLWRIVNSRTRGHTCYIHNWRTAARGWTDLAMASVSSLEESLAAAKLGYRTFRVRSPDELIELREAPCPAAAESGHKTVCALCLACGGRRAKAKVGITIVQHG